MLFCIFIGLSNRSWLLFLSTRASGVWFRASGQIEVRGVEVLPKVCWNHGLSS